MAQTESGWFGTGSSANKSNISALDCLSDPLLTLSSRSRGADWTAALRCFQTLLKALILAGKVRNWDCNSRMVTWSPGLDWATASLNTWECLLSTCSMVPLKIAWWRASASATVSRLTWSATWLLMLWVCSSGDLDKSWITCWWRTSASAIACCLALWLDTLWAPSIAFICLNSASAMVALRTESANWLPFWWATSGGIPTWMDRASANVALCWTPKPWPRLESSWNL